MFALRRTVAASLCTSVTAPTVVLRHASSSSRKAKGPSVTGTTSEYFKTYHPHTPGVRHLRRIVAPHLYAGRPVRELTVPLRKNGGRNNTGRITTRHRGGGHRKRVRLVDFERKEGGVWDVVRVEYDPGRSGWVALIKRQGGTLPTEGQSPGWAYILATDGMRAGDEVQSFRSGIPAGFVKGLEGIDLSAALAAPSSSAAADGKKKVVEPMNADSNPHYNPAPEPNQAADDEESRRNLALGIFRSMTLKSGNVLPLRLIPPGTVIHNVCLHPDGKAILARAAGARAQVVGHESANIATNNKNGGGDEAKYVLVRLQSGEVRKVLKDCCATVGKVGNVLWEHRMLGKAGRRRWLGWRPEVRGVAMNAKDHPHGGGRGKSKSNKHPVSIWGWGTQGTRTRKPGPKGPKNSNKMVIKERPRGVEKREGRKA